MKVSAALLRWYKSFNTNYVGYFDRRANVTTRPWNRLTRDAAPESEYPFIEIPLTQDITTIVGANESGKSHLLSAISKVITGKGIPDGFGGGREFSRTDLCHYTSPRNKNARDWPNIGLQFNQLTSSDMELLGNALSNMTISQQIPTADTTLTLIIAPDASSDTEAFLYIDENDHELNKFQLEIVRSLLPKVQFIRSEIAFDDQIPIHSLLAAYDPSKNEENDYFDFSDAQKLAKLISSFSLSDDNPKLDGEELKSLLSEKKTIDKARIKVGKCELELLLFEKVLGITRDTFQFMSELQVSERTHADGLVEQWNREIEEQLNLSHYWTQDDSFSLRLNYKQGIIYFEITDKTGATYTFRERSSGLRYFLSYYIQAKALEINAEERGAIVLMDEPDSFLSIIGQKNLLSVFESLVKPESSEQKCQLVYTTHSPFLINRNFPHRLKLVRKGDAEEGTQLIDKAMLRRYEPVRSALGIDCSQTLFMGATNVVVEGPTDQYLLSELIRHFARPTNINELLDLNSVVLVSAESAPSIEKVLLASQWGDETIPATVVLVDSDQGGSDVVKRITGKARKSKKLIEDQFVLQIGDIIKSERVVVTTEDLIPLNVFKKAILNYLERWWSDLEDDQNKQISSALDANDYAAKGVVEGTTKIFNEYIFKSHRNYDKYGVLEEVVRLVESNLLDEEDYKQLKTDLFMLCKEIRRAVSASQQAARRETGKQAVKRLIKDFFVQKKKSCSVFDMQLLLERIQRDLQLLGEDGEILDRSVKHLLAELRKLRSAGHQHLQDSFWREWKRVLESISKNPLKADVKLVEGIPEVSSEEKIHSQSESSSTGEDADVSELTEPETKITRSNSKTT